MVDNPQLVRKRLLLREDDLLGRIEEGDPAVRFVPFGYKLGKQSPQEFAQNPFNIALFGEEATILGELAKNYKGNPYLWSMDDVRQEMRALVVLNSDWHGHGLGIIGNGGEDATGFAFAVSNSNGEADE